MIHRTIDRLRALTGEGCTGGTAVGHGSAGGEQDGKRVR
jgi:hypothetical protein